MRHIDDIDDEELEWMSYRKIAKLAGACVSYSAIYYRHQKPGVSMREAATATRNSKGRRA